MNKFLLALITSMVFLGCNSNNNSKNNNKPLLGNCNPDGTILPLPMMYVYKDSADARIAAFSTIPNSKYDLLKQLNSKQKQFFTYSRKAVDSLLSIINKESGIAIYFARFTRSQDDGIPSNFEDSSVILLFATALNDNSKPKEYYLINDREGDDSVYRVKDSLAYVWMADYNYKVQPLLRNTINSNDTNNIDPYDVPVTHNDTKSIFYPKNSIEEAFTTEVAYQKSQHKVEISAYKVSFASYTDSGNENGGFKKRLHLIFDYIDTSGNTLNHETQPDFNCRTTLKSSNALNNGHLCPLNCPKP